MINIFYSDLHRILKGRVFVSGLALIFGYTFVLSLQPGKIETVDQPAEFKIGHHASVDAPLLIEQ